MVMRPSVQYGRSISASGVPYAPIWSLPSHSMRPGGSCVGGVDERVVLGVRLQREVLRLAALVAGVVVLRPVREIALRVVDAHEHDRREDHQQHRDRDRAHERRIARRARDRVTRASPPRIVGAGGGGATVRRPAPPAVSSATVRRRARRRARSTRRRPARRRVRAWIGQPSGSRVRSSVPYATHAREPRREPHDLGGSERGAEVEHDVPERQEPQVPGRCLAEARRAAPPSRRTRGRPRARSRRHRASTVAGRRCRRRSPRSRAGTGTSAR